MKQGRPSLGSRKWGPFQLDGRIAVAVAVASAAVLCPLVTMVAPALAAPPVSTIDLQVPGIGGTALTVDAAGNIYANSNPGVVEVTPSGSVSTLATSTGCAVGWPFFAPPSGQYCVVGGVAAAPDGTVYFSSMEDGRVYRVSTSGVITAIAGQYGRYGFSGDGGPATSALLFGGYPGHGELAVAPDGSVFLTDKYRIRRIAGGVIDTIAGTGVFGSTGDGGPATAANIAPLGLAFSPSGDLYFAEGARVRRIDKFGIITTVVGTGVEGYAGDGGPATAAEINDVFRIAFDPSGNMYFTTQGEIDSTLVESYRVRMVTSGGIITTVAGTGARGYSGDGGPALAAEVLYGGAAANGAAVAVDPATGDVYLAHGGPISGTGGLRRITRRGALAGVASSAGTPAAGVVVTVMEQWPSWKVARTATTGADGSWRFDDLPAGSYRVKFYDPQGRFQRQWWSAKGSYKSADPVTVSVEGETFANQDLGASAGGALSGIVRDKSNTPLAGIRVLAFNASGYIAGAVTGPNGGYYLNGLPAGSYWVRFVDPTPSAHWPTWYPSVVLFPNATTVSVGAGVTTVNGALPPYP